MLVQSRMAMFKKEWRLTKRKKMMKRRLKKGWFF
jgi:hypothetical protein